MKTKIILALTALSIYAAQAQTVYKFRKPTSNSGTYKFTSVKPGVDAYITVIGSKNATLSQIDDSSNFVYGWNPSLRYTSDRNRSTDTSYLEFRITFKKGILLDTQKSISLTALDFDGRNSYKEIISTSLPGTAKGLSSNSFSHFVDTSDSELMLCSKGKNCGGPDTTSYGAMAEFKQTNVTSFTIKVGVVGQVNSNNTKNFYFCPQPFTALLVPLPIKESVERKKIEAEEDEEPIQIFNFYGKMVFEGGYKDFLKNYAEAGEIYITSKGYKFIKE